jgi:hypothetical protein
MSSFSNLKDSNLGTLERKDNRETKKRAVVPIRGPAQKGCVSEALRAGAIPSRSGAINRRSC